VRVFLEVGFDETLRRMLERDRTPTSTPAEMTRRFWARYAPGQELYLSTARPRDRAHIVIDNTDPAQPKVVRSAGLP